MKKIIFSLLLVLFLNFQSARAACKINGEVVSCNEVFSQLSPIFIVMILLPLAIFAFWMWMLIDALVHDYPNKLTWIAVIFFTHIFGALFYYFLVKRPKFKISSHLKAKSKDSDYASTLPPDTYSDHF